jgi:hypothetical protein
MNEFDSFIENKNPFYNAKFEIEYGIICLIGIKSMYQN